MYKNRLLHNIFEDKKTRLDLILIMFPCLDNLLMKKHMNHDMYRKLQKLQNFFSVKLN